MTTFTETPAASTAAATPTAEQTASAREKYLADLNAREDALLRVCNGIRDAVVFPRLRAMGIKEADLHRAAMRLVRQVQWTRDFNGSTAKLLGIVRCGVNGTAAASEVV